MGAQVWVMRDLEGQGRLGRDVEVWEVQMQES